MSQGINEFLELFLQESSDRFEELGHELVKIEENPTDEETLYAILRHMHSIKGSAGMFGFDNLKLIAHRLEDLCDIIHKKPKLVTAKVMDTLFAGTDLLHASFKKISSSETGNTELSPQEKLFLEELDETIQALINDGIDLKSAISDLLESISEIIPTIEGIIDLEKLKDDIHKVENCLKDTSGELTPEIMADPLYFDDTDVSAQLLKLTEFLNQAENTPLTDDQTKDFFNTLAEFLTIITQAGISELDATLSDVNESITMFTDLELDFDSLQSEYYKEIFAEIIQFAEENPETDEQQTIEENSVVEKLQGNTQIRKTVRVEEMKIDNFLDNVGELIILGEIFNNLQKKFSNIISSDHLQLVREFSGANNDFSKQVFGLQKSLMDIRRIEINTITSSITRLVRDTARTLEKEISLEIVGENSVIDKSLLDDINTCMVHIVRNSCDHGIELPSTRETLGKNRVGNIKVTALNEDNALVLKIEDDGKGIDPEKVAATAISTGVCTQAEINEMSERQIMELIFQNGFSTAHEVSDISGRGVGMSSVLDNIKKSGGMIELNSERNKGTRIAIKIPLSIMLSVVDGLVVKSGGETFIIPIRYVVESFYITENEIIEYQKRGQCVKLRNEVLPVIRLDKILTLTPGEGGVCVVIRSDSTPFCLVVDEILDHQQVVIKRINGLESVRGIMGGALLGDGTVGLVLNIDVMSAIFIN